MGRAPCCNGEHAGLKKGPWTHEEDEKLRSFLLLHPSTSWRLVPQKAGLIRCGKSCRLRWMNYLRPDIRRGNFTPEEEDLIVQLHAAVGNKWSVIAAQLPGRTDNEIKNLWNTKLRKVLVLKGINPITHQPLCNPLLSDYVKQCMKSIEHMLMERLAGQPPPPAAAAATDGGADALCSSSSLNDTAHPPNLAPLLAAAPTEGASDEAPPPSSNPGPNTAKRSSVVADDPPACDGFSYDFMLGDDAFLPFNLGYLSMEESSSTAAHLSSGELEPMIATPGLFDYWS